MLRFLPLVYSALLRQPLRTLFSMLSVAAAFVLFGLLQGFVLGFQQLVDESSDQQLQVLNRTMSLGLYSLPVAHARAIERMEGVRSVVYMTGFGGYYQDPRNRVSAMAISDITFLVENNDFFQIDQQTLAEFEQFRTGAIVGRDLAEQHAWSVGDKFPVTGMPRNDGSNVWFLDVVGFWDNDTEDFEALSVIVHYDYVDEGRVDQKGTVSNLIVVSNGSRPGADVSAEIDDHFLNSSVPTRTASFQAMASARLDRVGDVAFYVNGIVGAALVIVLIATGGTMAQSVRDRQPEYAVLRSFGYPVRLIAALTVAEAQVICVGGASMGIGVAFLGASVVFEYIEFMSYVELPLSVLGYGFAAAVTLGMAVTAIPLLHLRRLSTVDALAGR